MNNKLKELEKLITILKNEEGLTDYGVILLEGWAVGMQWAVNKNCNLQSVSNWGEMKLACKYSKKHDKFTACLHKDADSAMICFDPAHCPMIKKWSNCAFNRPDC